MALHSPKLHVFASRRPTFDGVLGLHQAEPLVGGPVTTLQVNVGKRCNQACRHCHVDAGPNRTELMSEQTARRVLSLLDASPGVKTLDVTGGAPELSPCFRMLVRGARARGLQVIDRCNLTVLFEPGMEDLAEFLAEQRVHVVASLPCYGAENVDAQRGRGVFDKSIAALRHLNALGYATGDSGLRLDLVYNPLGPSLPPSQHELQARYKRLLRTEFGIEFGELLTITNMPLSRFAHALRREGKLDAYMELLVSRFNPGTVPGLMCRSLVSVGYDGKLYDCDFNQMANVPWGAREARRAQTIFELQSLQALQDRTIATAPHCLGCTAGCGSSCGGALQ